MTEEKIKILRMMEDDINSDLLDIFGYETSLAGIAYHWIGDLGYYDDWDNMETPERRNVLSSMLQSLVIPNLENFLR